MESEIIKYNKKDRKHINLYLSSALVEWSKKKHINLSKTVESMLTKMKEGQRKTRK